MGPGSGTTSAGEERLRSLLGVRLAERSFELPLLPTTATRVMQTCSDENCDARQLAALVQADMSLAANVLRIANSAAYASRDPIVSLQQAVSRLGLATLCNIAVAAAMKTEVFRVSGWDAWLKRLWSHSTRCGAWGKEIARARRKNVESAFLCGLLHDVGRAIVLKEACKLASQAGLALRAALVESWADALHPAAGAALLEAWSLPGWAVVATREHHSCLQAQSSSEEAYTVALADRIAHDAAEGEPTDAAREALARHPALECLGIYGDEFEALLTHRPAVEKLVQALG